MVLKGELAVGFADVVDGGGGGQFEVAVVWAGQSAYEIVCRRGLHRGAGGVRTVVLDVRFDHDCGRLLDQWRSSREGVETQTARASSDGSDTAGRHVNERRSCLSRGRGRRGEGDGGAVGSGVWCVVCSVWAVQRWVLGLGTRNDVDVEVDLGSVRSGAASTGFGWCRRCAVRLDIHQTSELHAAGGGERGGGAVLLFPRRRARSGGYGCIGIVAPAALRNFLLPSSGICAVVGRQ